jgi:hypothetical protein
MEQNNIYWNLQYFTFKKTKIDYNKIIMFAQNNLIIVIVMQSNVKPKCFFSFKYKRMMSEETSFEFLIVWSLTYLPY